MKSSNIDQTLAEQLQVNEREIKQRMELLDFTKEDKDVLRDNKEFIDRNIDLIVDAFYKKQIKVPAIALLIGDSETLRRLKGAMRRYVLELFDGHYDMDYVNRRLRIGIVHKRIGVEPKLYISAIWLLQETIVSAIDYEAKAKSEINSEVASNLKRALHKLFMLDTQYVFDTYIASLLSEVASARDELESYSAGLQETIAERTAQLEEMSLKDMLTSLYNQRAFYDHLRREISSAERYQEVLTIAYFDLDGFKKLNDSYGHKAGDEMLEAVGASVLASIRESDIGCRVGGDEFCIILPRTSQIKAVDVVNRLIKKFELASKKLPGKITFSFGVMTTGPEEFVATDTLVKEADRLMYLSKKKTRKKQDYHITLSEAEPAQTKLKKASPRKEAKG